MAEGYVDVPHQSYDVWKIYTIGRAFDLDGSFGCQCWDYASLFWRNIGFPAGYPQTGPNLSAYECWSVSRDANAGDQFDLIYSLDQVKTGDVIVLNGTPSNPPGHITFADEAYNGTSYMYCLGQNQGGTPQPGGGTAVTRNNIYVGNFLGAFRYRAWHGGPTPPPPSSFSRGNFPWVLYARKLRDRRFM